MAPPHLPHPQEIPVEELDAHSFEESNQSLSKKDSFSEVVTEAEESSFEGNVRYNDVTDEALLVNKPLNRKPVTYTLWVLQVTQATLMISCLFTVWSTTRLINQNDGSTIEELDETTIWSNIDMYQNGDCWDIVILIYCFCVIFPIFRIFLFSIAILMQTLYFNHEKWPITNENQAQSIADEEDEKELMPWWHVNAWKEGFRTKEGNMKLASMALDMLTICNKMAFTQYVMVCLLAWCLAVDFELELDNGGTAYVEIDVKGFYGVMAYELSYTITAFMVGLLVWQQLCWLRSYKERAIKGLNVSEVTSKPTANGLNMVEEMAEPLIPNESRVSTFHEPTRIDYFHGFLWLFAFVNWLVLTCGIDLARVEYSGQWMEGITKDQKTASFFGVIGKSFKTNDQTEPGEREFLSVDPMYNGYVYPTIVLMLMGYLVLGKLYRKAYDEFKYIQVFRVLRALYPMSPLEPYIVGYILFIIEIERITDPLLNEGEECQEEKCLTIEGKYVPGLLNLGLLTASMLWLFFSLRNYYGHMAYRI